MVVTRIAASTCVAGLMLSVGIPLLAAPVQAKEIEGCSSYGFECDKTGFGDAAYRSYWTMAPGHNCTNYVAWRMIQDGMSPKVSWLHNGGQWAAEARNHGFAVDDDPQPGDAAQWLGGSPNISYAGHVAYVEKVTSRSITVTEDNYSSGPLRVRTIFRGDEHWPSNFIHFNRPEPEPEPEPEPQPEPAVALAPIKVTPKLKDVTKRFLPDLKSLNIYG